MKILKLFVYLPFFVLAVLIIIIRPFKTLRFHEILSDRIGHFGCIIELYLCERDLEEKKNYKFKDFFCFSKNICNLQIKKFWQKELNILPYHFVAALIFWFKILPTGYKHLVFYSKKKIKNWTNFRHKDINNLIDKSKIHYSFTKKEKYENKKILENLGIDLNKKIALIFLRDDFYFKKILKFTSQAANISSKNPDINTYIKSVNLLINRGYQVIRIGKLSQKKLKIKNKYFFDITNSFHNNDSLQTYLISKSKFLICSNSGLSYVSSFIFRKPCLITNHIPHGHFHIETKLITINFKKVFCKKKKRFLKLSEIFDRNLFYDVRGSNYKKSNCKIVDQSEKEIYYSVLDFIKKIESKFKIKHKEKILKKKYEVNFKKILKNDNFRLNTFGKFKGNFGLYYLKNNKYLFY